MRPERSRLTARNKQDSAALPGVIRSNYPDAYLPGSLRQIILRAHLEIGRSVLPEMNPADPVATEMIADIRFRVVGDHQLSQRIGKERMMSRPVFPFH